MKKPEEIKMGLECCVNGYKCGKCCPYYRGKITKCTSELSRNALAYIQRLESKLAEYEKPNKPLPIGEIVAEYERTVPLGIDCAYVVEFREEGYVTRCLIDRMGAAVVAAWNCGAIDLLFERDYGKTWRCWPRKPTDKERKAAKWDD